MTNTTIPDTAAGIVRLRLIVRGVVQGVGFRPFVYRLAKELGLSGWVNNSPQGVCVEVEGARDSLNAFRRRLETENPPRSVIQGCECSWLEGVGHEGLTIRESAEGGEKSTLVLPDIATCPDCLRDIFDPKNRRYRYPFTNCTHCGPRFSIIEALPYDRANTSMRKFRMCPACQAEYDDPADRRFHAQPNACPMCGPRLELWAGAETPQRLTRGHDALLTAADAIRSGRIVAAKNVGGFHLLIDARNGTAIRDLRLRKQREEKAFAVLFPSLESIREHCDVSALEERLLISPEAPIVLVRRKGNRLAEGVAPGNPNLGAMLPSNPLQHLLMAELGFPVVATSGNLSDEPICTDELEALARLRGIADVFLVHNRPVVRHADDSIMREMAGREMVLRRARGYAPLPITLDQTDATLNHRPVLAVGAHLKNSVALALGQQVFISQHIGDLETEPAYKAFCAAAGDLPRLYDCQPEIVAADLHPDYLSTKYAAEYLERPVFSKFTGGVRTKTPVQVGVQHHIAHALSCIAENRVKLPVLGVVWDGTGYGTDGTIWGGEFFRVTADRVERVAHFRPFRLPGGEAAVKEPRRAAMGLLYELWGAEAFDRTDIPTVAAIPEVARNALGKMLAHELNAPSCCSVGRLFDAVASLLGLRQEARFEGQAAMELEFAIDGCQMDECYPISFDAKNTRLVLDWSRAIKAILVDLRAGVARGIISAKFHNTLAETVVLVSRMMGNTRVALSGGCFQNRYLTERVVERLHAEGREAFWHRQVPPNDGGIALGQVAAARREYLEEQNYVSGSTR